MPSTTAKQDSDFIAEIMPPRILEVAIAWIEKNFEPDDVFEKYDLERWAENNGYTKD